MKAARRNPRPILRMHWTRGRAPRVGCFLRNSSPRARLAYEVIEIKSSRPSPLGGILQRLACKRWEPKEVPEGVTEFWFHWSKREKARR